MKWLFFLPLIALPFFSLSASPLKSMSLEEKVGQLLMVHFNGEEVNDEARFLVQNIYAGGIIYYNWANGLHSKEQVATLSTELQKLTLANPHPLPLLIAADQEGGRVARLKQGFTLFPGNGALGRTKNPDLAKKAAFIMGEELRSVGINMNLAPVVDVNSDPQNPVIGERSFGNDPYQVALFGEQALLGYKQAGIIATLKHFPGYGDVGIDPHEDLPLVHKTFQELEKTELIPFAKLAPLADAIMTAHILVPAFDDQTCSTLSEKTLRYLRDTLHFQGVIVADSLVMEGVIKKCQTVHEAALLALNAGCDILILGGKLLSGQKKGFELSIEDVQKVHHHLVEAVKSGKILESRVDEAVHRILALKEKHPLMTAKKAPFSQINTSEQQEFAQKIISLSK